MRTPNARHGANEGSIELDRRGRGRSTRAYRSARSTLLESTARGLSRYGYLVLEQVASDAGHTRGALYHRFKDKQQLTLVAVEWVLETPPFGTWKSSGREAGEKDSEVNPSWLETWLH